MSKQDTSTKIFKIKFSKAIYALIIGVVLLCLASIAVSAWQILRFGLSGFTDFLRYPLLILISVFCIAVVISMLMKSQYTIDKKHLISYYGFIKSRFPVQKITTMLFDTDTKKLTIRFGEQFIVLNMDYDWRDDFIRALTEANPEISYSFTMAENKPPKDEEK